MPDHNVIQEGERIMTICNSCRYCEGFCAVFPAMEMRKAFTAGDMNYLANLCHNCTECLHACQYAPPHEFKVNVPLTLARIRTQSYERYARPARFARILKSHGVAASFTLTVVMTAALAGGLEWFGHRPLTQPRQLATFYDVVPHDVMVSLFGIVSTFVLLALLMGLVAYLDDTGPAIAGDGAATVPTIWRGFLDALQLKYLHGSGVSCAIAEEARTPWRRLSHHFTFYGFLLCLASTSVGALYHNVFGWVAPYSYTSLPVILGTVGGIGLVVGCVGLAISRTQRDTATFDQRHSGLDISFITMLVFVSVTGLALLVLRATPAMTALLVVHLAAVLALLLTLPYGKFVHGIYRTAALVQYARECGAGLSEPGEADEDATADENSHTVSSGAAVNG